MKEEIQKDRPVMVSDLDKLSGFISNAFTEVNNKFDEVYRRFERVDERFDAMDRRFDRLEMVVGGHGNRLDIVEDRVVQLGKHARVHFQK